MKDYNQEYFFLRRKGNNFPLVDYINWPDSDIDYLEEEFEDKRVIPFMFSEPLPNAPQIADLHTCAYKLVISKKIKDILSKMYLKNIQFIPATIQDSSGEMHEEYYIIHIYNLIECMDMKASAWEADMDDPEMVYNIEKLVLDNEKLNKIPIENRLVLALQEHPLTTVYHRTIIEKILAAKPTGVGVYCLADWDGSNPFEDEFWDYIMS